jgi:hypothetical protein
VTLYSGGVKMCEDFGPKFGDKRTGCCITTTHNLTLPFPPGILFTKNNMTVVSIHSTSLIGPLRLFAVSPNKDKIQMPPF